MKLNEEIKIKSGDIVCTFAQVCERINENELNGLVTKNAFYIKFDWAIRYNGTAHS